MTVEEAPREDQPSDTASQTSAQPLHQENKKRIVIVGAGVAGLYVAKNIQKRKDATVTLISPDTSFVFLPRLTELFSKVIPEQKGSMQLADVWKGPLMNEKATIVNPQEKHVVLESGKTVPYDILVIAVGSVTNFFNTQGNQYAYPFYSKTDMERLREHITSLLEGDEQPGTRTFAIVGAGPTGCEVAYALSKLLEEKKAKGNILLLDRSPTILSAFPQKLREAVTEKLEKRGIQLISNASVMNITPMSIDIQKNDAEKENIPCYTTIWAAGSKPSPIALTGIEKTPRGELPVKPTLQLQGDDNIFVLGDCAASGCPKTAQAALQQAEVVSKNIERSLAGKELALFAFKDKGVIIALDNDTVGLFYGKLLKGFLAQQIRDKYYMMTVKKYT